MEERVQRYIGKKLVGDEAGVKSGSLKWEMMGALNASVRNLAFGDPWVAQQFGARLWPRARFWRPGIESHVGLPVHGACFYLCLCL